MRSFGKNRGINMIRKAMLGLLAIGLVALPGLAQSKPDFSGTWKLNVGKSDFGQVPGPDSETMVVIADVAV